MHGGPMPTYSSAEVAKFSEIAALAYEAKRIAIDRLTPQERSKFNHFFENLTSDFNEGIEAPVRAQSTSITLDALIEEDIDNTEDEAFSATQTLIYSAPTSIKASTTMTYSRIPDEEIENDLQSVLANLDLDSDSSEEEVIKKKSPLLNRASHS